MVNLVFDIETDDLDATKIWCIVAQDVDTSEFYLYGPSQIKEGAKFLYNKADKLIGHNIIGFDIPVIKRLVGYDLSDKQIVDTLVLSRLFNPVREGNHGLESWGYRLAKHKKDKPDFQNYSDQMLSYCKADVELNTLVYKHLKTESKGFSRESVDLEHATSSILNEQRDKGFVLDEKKASLLLAQLVERMGSVKAEVLEEYYEGNEPSQIVLMPEYTKGGKLSKVAPSTAGKRFRLTSEEYERVSKASAEELELPIITRTTVQEFNLGSRKQIGEYLKSFGWKPKNFTPTGQPIVDEGTLNKIKGIPQAKLIAEYLMLQKRIAQVSSWYEAVHEDGRVHGFVNHNGTITGRMTHRDPNLAQVPSVSSPYGKECRACWTVPLNHKLLGIDASGLELRMLAHYMKNKEFTNEIVNGDIHSTNQKLAGLESRTQAKTFIYALLYGAGDAKLGSVVGGTKADGKRIREHFFNNLPSFENLRNRVARASTRGYLKGLDGRKIFIRSQHAALNSLLQGAGAIVMKKALVLFNEEIKRRNLCAWFVANVHDEWQIEVINSDAKHTGDIGIECIKKAGESFELNCPLDAEYKIGDNWYETH